MNVLSLLRGIYNSTIRKHLPYKLGILNGVAVKHKFKLLDLSNCSDEYEASLCESIKNCVCSGDTVVIVGGGLGVSSVVAANHVGTDGVVHTFEASDLQYNRINTTVSLNKVGDRVNLNHSYVSKVKEKSVKKYGSSGGATFVPATDLPKCDVLELDCEGVEKNILKNMTIRPESIVVETHGYIGSKKSDVKKILNELEYEIIQEKVENKNKGIYVLTARIRDI